MPLEIGTISNLVVSKGYFPDRTFDNFIVKRAVYGTNNFVQKGSNVTIYPNPFNTAATISVDMRGLPATAHRVQVSIVDLAGNVVMKMPVKTVSGTGFTTLWNGCNAAGKTISNGVYFINVTIDGMPQSCKVIKQ